MTLGAGENNYFLQCVYQFSFCCYLLYNNALLELTAVKFLNFRAGRFTIHQFMEAWLHAKVRRV